MHFVAVIVVDMHYVLINYKTEVCRRPHRLCRQGYACPSYHNLRDKRRSPRTYKYRLVALVAWYSGRTLVFDRQTFPVLHSTYS